MDITSLVETIGNNIVQFQPTIQGVVSAVLTTLFLRKNTNISEFEKMKAGKYSEALDDLLENGKITYFELYKCQNFLKIAKIADEYHQEKQEEESKFFDFDWFMRFFDTAGNVSSEKMQRLWAKILSNEIENVGSFSLRAIETLKNMNQHEASLFQQMAHFVLTDSSGIKFLLSTDNDLGVNVNEKYGLTKADIITLEECGILNSLRNDNRISLDSNPCGIWSENILLILKLKNSDGGLFSYKYSGYSLTKAACQLLSIVDSEPNDEYLLDVGREFARKYSGNFIVKAHKVLDSSVDTFKYDSDLAFQSGHLAIIFGNLLENALEACRKLPQEQRYIILETTYIEEMLQICIKNSSPKKFKKDNSGRYLTTKKDTSCHGIGLASVEQALADYDGELFTQYENGEFQASAVLYSNSIEGK